MKISFQGFENAYATFALGDASPAGTLVALSGDGAVTAATDGDFIGLLTSVRDGKALVQLRGYAALPYADSTESGASAMARGYTPLAVADGVLTTSATGRRLLVVELDSTAKTCGVIL